MPKIDVYDIKGNVKDKVEISKDIFDIEVNKPVLFDALVMQRASLRQGTHKAKTRSEVSGGGKKPWRQKGTGRARQGSIRSPQWRGGGIVFGPTPRSYKYKINKKEARLALKSSLTLKQKEKEIFAIDKFNLKEIKTKQISDLLKKLKINRKVMIVDTEYNEVVARSANNIPNVIYRTFDSVNTLEVTNSKTILFSKDSIKKLEEVFN